MKLKYKISYYILGLTDYIHPKYATYYESVFTYLSIKPLGAPYE